VRWGFIKAPAARVIVAFVVVTVGIVAGLLVYQVLAVPPLNEDVEEPPDAGRDVEVLEPLPDWAKPPEPKPPEPLRFDVAAWLKERGLTWLPDNACWEASPGEALYNRCTCHQVLELPTEPREILVCKVNHGQTAPAIHVDSHTVLYVKQGRRLRMVLDLPTAAGQIQESCSHADPGCRVYIIPKVEDGAIRFVNAPSDPGWSMSCEGAFGVLDQELLTKETSRERAEVTALRRIYKRICDGRGLYRWRDGELRHIPENPSGPLKH
jgi:hypothetical protein